MLNRHVDPHAIRQLDRDELDLRMSRFVNPPVQNLALVAVPACPSSA